MDIGLVEIVIGIVVASGVLVVAGVIVLIFFVNKKKQ